MRALFKFRKETPFKVLECDKNIGVAIISQTLYDHLVFEHLSNDNYYLRLNENPLQLNIDNICETLKSNYEKGFISEKIKKFLIFDNEVKLGSLRLLPKLHKQTFSCRPIINCSKNPTSKFIF